jgi:hypothetical protein
MLPLFLTGALLMGCEDKTAKSPDPATAAKADDAKADADKSAADAKAKADKVAADAKADADKVAANAKADADKAAAKADKVAANAKADAAKAAMDAKTAAIKASAEAGKDQAAKLLSDLQTAVKDQRWTDAGPIIKQLDALRDKLPADQQATFDSLKKQYNDNKP